ncbi:MAG: hypothetical protein QOE75_1169 [Solirubrobacterales bacterium]|jgi:hypothetical protein|nr:hypothetical protein [Solirubrobacterales bacterium]
MDLEGQELVPYEPVPDTLVLAAIERATRQGPETVWPVHLGEHLGFRHQGHSTRKLRDQLERLRVQDRTVERLDRMGRDYWKLTPVGERVLAEARAENRLGDLPESPQHRKWRKGREGAAERIDSFRGLLSAAIQDIHTAELEPGEVPSERWLALRERLNSATWLVASATYCLHEWPEPSEDCVDADPDLYLAPRRRAYWSWDQHEAMARGERP